MNIQLIKLFQLSKLLHRITLFSLVMLGIIMGTTGTVMKFPQISLLLPFVSADWARYVHNQISVLFSLAFFIMSLTGLYMYWFPWYSGRQRGKN